MKYEGLRIDLSFAPTPVCQAMNAQIARLEAELSSRFEQHPDAWIIRSLRGRGTILGAQVLGEFGDDPNRYANPKGRKNYAGMSSITRPSWQQENGPARHVGIRRLEDAIHLWAPLGSQRLSWSACLLRQAPGCRRYPSQGTDVERLVKWVAGPFC
jgi:hypothetical protein